MYITHVSPMKFWSLVSVMSLLVACSLTACAKNKHQRLDGYAVQDSGSMTLEPIYQENADRPRDGMYGPPPMIPECEPPPDDWHTRGGTTPPVRYQVQGAPEGTDALSRALRARHAEDVPSLDLLRRDPNIEVQLRYLASHGDLMIERQRALTLLRNFPSEATRALFVQLSESPTLHVSVRSLAIEGLAIIADPGDGEAQRILERARQSEEPRLRKAANTRIHVQP